MRERLNQSFPGLLDQLEAFGKKLVSGQATLEDMVNMLKAHPPELRKTLAENPECSLFKPEVYEQIIAFAEQLLATETKPQTPETSQFAAIRRILEKRTALGFNILDAMAKVPAAYFNIGKHVETGMPLNPQSLQSHDELLFASLRLTRSSKELSPVLHERMHIAGQSESRRFKRRLGSAFSKEPDLRPPKLLQDLQLPILKQFLLSYWIEIPNIVPRVGLCEFSYKAIGKFCMLLSDPEGKRSDDPFDEDKIRDAVRRLGLVRKQATVTKLEWTTKNVSIVHNGKLTILMKADDAKGGQKTTI